MELGVYICTGCNIEEALDINSLSEEALKNEQVKTCIAHEMLCGKAGLKALQDDIQKNKLDHVVIAACSQRHHIQTFLFPDVYTERVNLREQVAWCQKAKDEDTQMLADDLLRMGITKALNSENPKPYLEENLSSDIMVVGAGITGLTAAIEGANAGYKVLLVEKESELGGMLNKVHKHYPKKAPFDKLVDNPIEEAIHQVHQHKNITTLIDCQINEISGQPGMFTAIIKSNGVVQKHKVASIILANGWKPYDASRLKEFGYGVHTNVITGLELEKMTMESHIIRPSDGKRAKQVLFIQCAGSRDKNHLPYCSNYCCATTLKQTRYIRKAYKDSIVYVAYKDIRTPGHSEGFYKEVQNDDQLFFTKGDIQEISQQGNKVRITIQDKLMGETIQLQVDLVVLATGMTPNDTDCLNLNYRQGKGLPSLKYEFPDSHFICFPYETRRTGIYAAGAVRAPQDCDACIEDALGAVFKAIQCIENVKLGKTLHPRSGDESYPVLSMERCTDCKRCTEECPFGSYDETEKGTPLPNPNRCRSCGICMGACPERIINFDDFSINAVSAMIKAVEVPDEFDEKPRILAFVCENDAYPAFDMAGFKRLEYSAYLRIIPVRCIGSVNKIWISDALSHGYDGIMLFGCKPGEDYQCHFIHGSELTQERGENIRETLQKMMLEEERIKTVFLEISEYDKIPKLIEDYLETIENIGYNPFKGM